MWTIIKKQKLNICAYLMLGVIYSGVEIGLAIGIKMLFEALEGVDTRLFKYSIGVFLVDLILNYFIGKAKISTRAEIYKKVNIDVKMKILRYILGISEANYRSTSFGEKLNYFDYYINCFDNFYLDGLLDLIENCMIFTVIFSYMMHLNAVASMVTIFLLVLSLVIPNILGKKISIMIEKNENSNAEYLSTLKDVLAGIEDIHNYKVEEHFEMLFKRDLTRNEKAYKVLLSQEGTMNIIIGNFQYLIIICTFLVSGMLVFRGKTTIPNLIAVGQLSNMLIQPVQEVELNIMNMLGSKDLIRKLDKILSVPIGRNRKKDKLIGVESIEVKDLSYKVDGGRLIFDKVSFELEKGKKYALIGPNGSGKTTICKILKGDIKEYGGDVLVNGQKNIDNKDASICSLPQKVHLFNGSILDNIYIGRNLDKSRVSRLVDRYGLRKLMEVNESKDISGGELKRVGIVRTFSEEASVYLLDEPEAGLDGLGQKMLEDEIVQASQTVLIVCHHISDKILDKLNDSAHIIV